MIIIGLQNCESCKILKARHPDLEYIELPRKGITEGKLRDIKRLIGKNKLDQFPLLMKNDMSGFIPMKTLDADFAAEYYKLF